MKRHLVVLACALPACEASPSPGLPGGELTVFDRTSNAYGNPAPGLSQDELSEHVDGDAAFEASFVTSPAPRLGGLGPTFNHTSCNGCHPRDGRGLAHFGGPPLLSPMLIRVSLPEGIPDAPGGAVPVPQLGTQLQDHAVFGVDPEVEVELTWEESTYSYGDGTPYTLRRPRLSLSRPDGTALPDDLLMSARIAPPVFGLGLLEAIPERTILALADPDDEDGDGISGRPNYAWDPRIGVPVLGRFGWKANTPDLELQVGNAFFNDMGLTSPLHPEEDGSAELTAEDISLTRFYLATLGVPARVTLSQEAENGERLFGDMGCASCHVPSLETGVHEFEILENQAIEPYTDLLLHDLGDGLADHRPDWLADGREWRTPPLWGIGLTETVLPLATYLHDGRARNLAEAILWHGGEGEGSREAFRTASAKDREALIAFLRAL